MLASSPARTQSEALPLWIGALALWLVGLSAGARPDTLTLGGAASALRAAGLPHLWRWSEPRG